MEKSPKDDYPLVWSLQAGRYELRNESILGLLRSAKIGTLSLIFESWPMTIPLAFVFRAGEIFAYCPDDIAEANVIQSVISTNNSVSFHVLGLSSYFEVKAPCPSVSIFGRLLPSTDIDKSKIHELFCEKYCGSALLPSFDDESRLIRIAGQRICGSDLLPE